MNKRESGFAIGAIILSAAAGVVAGFLTAPKTGKDTREDIKKHALELKQKAMKKRQKLSKKSQK